MESVNLWPEPVWLFVWLLLSTRLCFLACLYHPAVSLAVSLKLVAAFSEMNHVSVLEAYTMLLQWSNTVDPGVPTVLDTKRRS